MPSKHDDCRVPFLNLWWMSGSSQLSLTEAGLCGQAETRDTHTLTYTHKKNKINLKKVSKKKTQPLPKTFLTIFLEWILGHFLLQREFKVNLGFVRF